MKKAFISMRFYAMSMYGVTLAKPELFLPSFLQMLVMWSSKINFLWSHFTPNSFSVSLLSVLKPSTYILTLSFVLTNKWHLSRLLFKRLFLTHANKSWDTYSRDVIRLSMLSAIIWYVVIRITGNIDVIYSKKQIF